ncbi:MAG TPA: SRPBCC family protein [Mucilaginibacter sp.]|jgi:hypothetical protein|nr:SRPBCC family protein [Mucilaginibacter sp.]
MKIDVVSDISINAPLEYVAGYASNPENASEWYVNIKSAEFLTTKPIDIGSQVAFRAKFLGRQLEYVYEVVEWQPLEKLVMITANGPFPMQTTYTWEKIGSGKTKMFLRNTGEPSGFSKFVAPFMAFAIKRANKKDLEQLKKILEK